MISRSKVIAIAITIGFISLIIFFLGPASSQNQKPEKEIFFELSTGGFFGLREEGEAGFSEFKRDAQSRGFSVSDNLISDKALGWMSPSITEESDTIVIVNPMRELQDYEINMLEGFVGNGSNLLVICDSLDSIYYSNQILEVFGVQFKKEYLLDTKVDVIGNETINLKFSIPVEHYGEFAVNGTAEYSKDLITETEGYNKKRTILSATEYGEGKVIALGSKEPFMNHNYDKQKGFVHLVLHLLESDISLKPKINITPSKLEIILVNQKASLSTINLENREDYPINVSVEVPEFLEDKLRFFEKRVTLKSKEETQLYLLFEDNESKYGNINTEIAFQVKGKTLNVTHNYTMPVKVINI